MVESDEDPPYGAIPIPGLSSNILRIANVGEIKYRVYDSTSKLRLRKAEWMLRTEQGALCSVEREELWVFANTLGKTPTGEAVWPEIDVHEHELQETSSGAFIIRPQHLSPHTQTHIPPTTHTAFLNSLKGLLSHQLTQSHGFVPLGSSLLYPTAGLGVVNARRWILCGLEARVLGDGSVLVALNGEEKGRWLRCLCDDRRGYIHPVEAHERCWLAPTGRECKVLSHIPIADRYWPEVKVLVDGLEKVVPARHVFTDYEPRTPPKEDLTIWKKEDAIMDALRMCREFKLGMESGEKNGDVEEEMVGPKGRKEGAVGVVYPTPPDALLHLPGVHSIQQQQIQTQAQISPQPAPTPAASTASVEAPNPKDVKQTVSKSKKENSFDFWDAKFDEPDLDEDDLWGEDDDGVGGFGQGVTDADWDFFDKPANEPYAEPVQDQVMEGIEDTRDAEIGEAHVLPGPPGDKRGWDGDIEERMEVDQQPARVQQREAQYPAGILQYDSPAATPIHPKDVRVLTPQPKSLGILGAAAEVNSEPRGKENKVLVPKGFEAVKFSAKVEKNDKKYGVGGRYYAPPKSSSSSSSDTTSYDDDEDEPQPVQRKRPWEEAFEKVLVKPPPSEVAETPEEVDPETELVGMAWEWDSNHLFRDGFMGDPEPQRVISEDKAGIVQVFVEHVLFGYEVPPLPSPDDGFIPKGNTLCKALRSAVGEVEGTEVLTARGLSEIADPVPPESTVGGGGGKTGFKPKAVPRSARKNSVVDGDVTMEDAPLGEGSKDLFLIPPPKLTTMFKEKKIEYSVLAQRYWTTIGLAPLGGPRNVSAIIVYPGSEAMSYAADSFLNRMRGTWELNKLGKHRAFMGGSKVAVNLGGSEKEGEWEGAWRMMNAKILGVGRQLRSSAAQDSGAHFVVYIVNPFNNPAATAALCGSFAQMEKLYQSGGDKMPRTSVSLLPMRMLVGDEWGCRGKLNQREYLQMALALYERLGFTQQKALDVFSKSPVAKPWVLAHPVPTQINFRLSTHRSPSILHENMMLHVAYAVSEDGRWLCVAWCNEHGEYTFADAFRINLEDPGAKGWHEAYQKAWTKTMEIISVMKIHWRVVVAKHGFMTTDEMSFWLRLSTANEGASPYSLTLASVDVDSNLALSTFGDQPLRLDDLFDPEDFSEYKSVDQTLKEGLGYKDDETWGMILNYRVPWPCEGESEGAMKYPAMSAYLLRRAEGDVCEGVQVHLLYARDQLRPLMKDILGQYRNLAVLRRYSNSRQSVPWHIWAVQRLQEGFKYLS
ncbi:hypothetical protein SAICODRAFT_16033 [Saitoella complicata NRRL Y-17804]|uniref:uncharacterized protein n=1 Tax=Saitoella complicata (strain BCRC 22490 / CBS 7301 / JCM 7358 / NBRC 10748 / NRRL Y-17804) TaxID=698492 RepID=UPI000867F225|nr:uncharacterized protein SAICODRAFT_16033 [Saitoella complicata NRRL Y-17804]ODQ55978.1 hypothetical protein SAICODRAFT_16033 [Saitoella complicata NRRL Y-17804]